MATGRKWQGAAAGITMAGVVGLGLLAAPGGAGADPVLPAVTPEELVASVLEADPEAFAGTVELDNALGLPALPDVPQAGNGSSTARVWSDGDDGGRVQLPTDDGEKTFVTDGESFWAWDSADRTVVTGGRGGEGDTGGPDTGDMADPSAAATEAIRTLQTSSTVTVEGTAQVAGRAAYELVLAPAPQERTLLREIRVAVDAEQRIPLQLTVLANGSTDPVLTVGFTELIVGAQDPALFTFTPPPGATVESPERPAPGDRPDGDALAGAVPAVVGDGWDTVLVGSVPIGDGTEDARGQLGALGTPVSGPWGSGTLIGTAVAGAIVTDDGRFAAGAVPEQVLTEALAQ